MARGAIPLRYSQLLMNVFPVAPVYSADQARLCLLMAPTLLFLQVAGLFAMVNVSILSVIAHRPVIRAVTAVAFATTSVPHLELIALGLMRRLVRLVRR